MAVRCCDPACLGALVGTAAGRGRRRGKFVKELHQFRRCTWITYARRHAERHQRRERIVAVAITARCCCRMMTQNLAASA